MPPAPPDEDPGTRPLTVSEFTRRVKSALQAAIEPCWVKGEVSNLRAVASGHVYFSLKDAGAQLSAVMFRTQAARSAVKIRDGLQVVAFGEIGVYEAQGKYQLVVRTLVDDGVGALQRQYEELKKRLAAEGLFDAARKKPIPLMPVTIGFVTSPTGAAVQDFMRILIRRGWRGRVVVLPSKVQGEGAAAEMAAMLELAQGLGLFDLDRHRPRRRQQRGPLGLQRGGPRARRRRVHRPDDLVRRARDRLLPLRLRGGPAGGDAERRGGARSRASSCALQSALPGPARLNIVRSRRGRQPGPGRGWPTEGFAPAPALALGPRGAQLPPEARRPLEPAGLVDSRDAPGQAARHGGRGPGLAEATPPRRLRIQIESHKAPLALEACSRGASPAFESSTGSFAIVRDEERAGPSPPAGRCPRPAGGSEAEFADGKLPVRYIGVTEAPRRRQRQGRPEARPRAAAVPCIRFAFISRIRGRAFRGWGRTGTGAG